MRGIDHALFLDMESSSSKRKYGSSSSPAIGPGLVVEALLTRKWRSLGIVEIGEVVVAVVSILGFIVGAGGEGHGLRRRQAVGLLSGEELRCICSERAEVLPLPRWKTKGDGSKCGNQPQTSLRNVGMKGGGLETLRLRRMGVVGLLERSGTGAHTTASLVHRQTSSWKRNHGSC